MEYSGFGLLWRSCGKQEDSVDGRVKRGSIPHDRAAEFPQLPCDFADGYGESWVLRI